MTSLRKSLMSQLASPVLTVDANFRVCFVGGAVYDVVERFATSREAGAAYMAAIAAADRLDEIARGVRQC